jgi:adenylate cyclase
MERKLTAILCADVAGYSRLMGQNEVATLSTLTSHRRIIDSLIEQHRGRFVNSAGDSVLAEFASVVNAVQCASEIQAALRNENENLPAERRMELRIGVNLGDVMVEGEQIYGDGVNVAARLESLADPGGICISAKVHDEVAGKLELAYQDLGPQRVKNIAEPLRAWRIAAGTVSAVQIRRSARRRWNIGIFSLTGLAIIAATVILVQHVSIKAPPSHASIPAQQKPALTLPDKPSIAVLPFINLSGDPKQDYFSDGITDYLITDLSRLPGLFVIARNSTFTYKGKAVTVQQIGRELGVRTLLEGSVFKGPNQVRVAVRLSDATTGVNLWAARFDKPLKDVFTVQDEIVRDIVTTLNLLSQAAKMQLPPGRFQPTNNLEAFDYWLRGVELEWGLTKEQNLQAREMYQKAIALDPNYADAYAALAWDYLGGLMVQYDKDPKTPQRVVEFAERAIALDDANETAYMALGEFHAMARQYEQAIAEEKRAIAIDPSNPMAYFWFGDLLYYAGQPAEAISLEEQAMRLDPRNADWYVIDIGCAHDAMGQYAEALPFLKQHEARYPDNIGVHEELAFAYSQLGRLKEARAEAAEIMRLNPQFSLKDREKLPGPFKDQAINQRYRAALRKAGLK